MLMDMKEYLDNASSAISDGATEASKTPKSQSAISEATQKNNRIALFLAIFPITGALGMHSLYLGQTKSFVGHMILCLWALLTYVIPSLFPSNGMLSMPGLSFIVCGIPLLIISYIFSLVEIIKQTSHPTSETKANPVYYGIVEVFLAIFPVTALLGLSSFYLRKKALGYTHMANTLLSMYAFYSLETGLLRRYRGTDDWYRLFYIVPLCINYIWAVIEGIVLAVKLKYDRKP